MRSRKNSILDLKMKNTNDPWNECEKNKKVVTEILLGKEIFDWWNGSCLWGVAFLSVPPIYYLIWWLVLKRKYEKTDGKVHVNRQNTRPLEDYVKKLWRLLILASDANLLRHRIRHQITSENRSCEITFAKYINPNDTTAESCLIGLFSVCNEIIYHKIHILSYTWYMPIR